MNKVFFSLSFVFFFSFSRKKKMASLLRVSPAGGSDDGKNDLASLLERAKTAGLAHERELALLAGRSAIARTTIDGNCGNFKRGVFSAASRAWCRHALSGALDEAESKECRR